MYLSCIVRSLSVNDVRTHYGLEEAQHSYLLRVAMHFAALLQTCTRFLSQLQDHSQLGVNTAGIHQMVSTF